MTAIMICVCMLLTSVGCKKSSETSILKDKNLDVLIEKAESYSGDALNINGLAGKYESYKAKIEDKALDVTVNVDAKVSITPTDKVSVFRISQKKFTQDFIDKVRKELMGDIPLYDGDVLTAKTKKDIEDEILSWLKEIESAEAKENPNLSYIKYAKEYINDLQKQYESAPENIVIADYPYDEKIRSTSDGESYCAISDGVNGCYQVLNAENSVDSSGSISYFKSYSGYHQNGIIPKKKGTSITTDELAYMYGDASAEFKTFPQDSVTLTKEEAVLQAEAFLNSVGITDFKIDSGDVFTEITSPYRISAENNEYHIRSYYILTFTRCINGTPILPGKGKFIEGMVGDIYKKRTWDIEKIVLRINDGGIIGFDYFAPIQIDETVVDKAALSSFVSVTEAFEKAVTISCSEVHKTNVINIDTVSFGYAMISERDNFDTALLVPVWDFSGQASQLVPGELIYRHITYMTVNAIDNSVIDRTLGY